MRMVEPARGARRVRFPLYLQIIAAIAVGLVVGPLLGKQASGAG